MTGSPADLDVSALFDGALSEVLDDEGPCPCLLELHTRGTREIFERAVLACGSERPEQRLLGVWVLRELGGSPPRFVPDATRWLLHMLRSETVPIVVARILSALGCQHMAGRLRPRLAPTDDVLQAVLARATHEDSRVRFQVAAALPALLDAVAPDGRAVRVLIALAADPDADTRYYALAALVDDLALAARADVRAALAERLEDGDDQIRRAARRVIAGGTWAE